MEYMTCLIKHVLNLKSCAEEGSPCITLFRFLKGTRFGPCKQGLGLLGFLCMDRRKWLQCSAGQPVFYEFDQWPEFLMLTNN